MDGELPIQGISIYGDERDMKDRLVRTRKYDDAQDALKAITRALERLEDHPKCVLLCLQPHHQGFYHEIDRTFSAHSHVLRPRGLRAALVRPILGASALIEVERYDVLPSLFARISEQAMAALCVTGVLARTDLSSWVSKTTSEIRATVCEDPKHLLYEVDEDAGHGDDIVEMVSAGPDCPEQLKQAVGLVGASQWAVGR